MKLKGIRKPPNLVITLLSNVRSFLWPPGIYARMPHLVHIHITTIYEPWSIAMKLIGLCRSTSLADYQHMNPGQSPLNLREICKPTNLLDFHRSIALNTHVCSDQLI